MKTRTTSVATAVGLALSAAALSARAQDAGPAAPAQGGQPQLETVVVTGYRASLEQSLEKKRDSDSLVEIVTADDIGKLPDKNVADAVQRVPGVNISSGSGGEGGFSENDRVSIRGTNPSLTQTTLNGHTIATGDWYIGDQTQTVGRSVSFTLLPAEIVGSVEVQKSSQADYIEGGTVGNVNIVTRKPFDFKKTLTTELTAQALHGDLPDHTDPQVNGLVNWKNAADNFGVLLQGFYEARHERRDGQELFLLGEGQVGPATGPNADPVAVAHPDLANVFYPTQIGSAAFSQHSERAGGLVDFELKPSDALTLDLNGFYSHFNGTNFDTNFMASPLNELGAGIAPSSYKVVNGTLVSASFPTQVFDPNNPGGSAFPGVRDSIFRPDAASSAGYADLDLRFKASEALLFTAKLGYTRGTGETPHDYGYEAFLINSPLLYQMQGTTAPAIVQFPGVDTTNFKTSTVVNGGSWSDSVKVTDQESYAQADGLLRLDRGIVESAKFGIRYAKHDRSDFGVNYGCSADPNNPCYTLPNQLLPEPAWNNTVSPSNFGAGFGMGPGYLQHFWIMDVNSITAWQSTYNAVNTGPNYQGNFTIDEKDSAAYGMVNLAGARWRGNLGLRLVDTRQLSNAFDLNPDSGVFSPTSVSHSYFDVLPSANLKFDITHDLIARFAAARTMSRADYSALSPAVILNNLDLTGSGGNADLKPIRSNNFDAALEWYYAPQSILSLAAFYMDMPSYVTFGANIRPFLDTQIQQIVPFIIDSPFNIAAKNHGLEFSWQQPLWGGFGVLANYTYADGHAADGSPLVGSSKNTGNAELYYDAHGFNARLAYTYRSSFLVGLANVTSQYEAGIGTLAASINWKITDNFSFTADGLNLNNPVLKYYSNAEQPQAFYSNGRQYYLGIRLAL